MERLDNLIEVFSKLQGVGKKSATRIAFDILSKNKSDIERLIFIIKDSYENIKECKICHCFSEEEICEICSDEKTDRSTICVVENYKDVLAIKKSGRYNGLYHILGGKIDPLNDITPEKLNLLSLIKRIDENVEEIILALSPDMEGETTIHYIVNMLKDVDIKITRLASGIPLGANIVYSDSATLIHSIEGRISLK